MKTNVLLCSLVVLLLAACTTPAPVETQPTNASTDFLNPGYHEITIKNYAFTPKSITVYQGDRVKWINAMPFVKSVWIWGQPPSPAIKTGYSWSYVFTETGVYKYRDQFTQDMEGNITVLPYEQRPDLQQNNTPFGP